VHLAGATGTDAAAERAESLGHAVQPHAGARIAGAGRAAVLREAVTNVVRHSRAHTCRISFDEEPTGLVLEVTNDGSTGSGDASPGMGLDSMAQRLRALGGSVRTRRTGEVHTLTVVVPAHRGVAVPG
jgi:signal transduction histidine kinase